MVTSHTEVLSAYRCSSHWLFGGESRLVDRAKPGVEAIWLPPAETTPGSISISLSSAPIRSKPYRRGAWLTRRWKALSYRDGVLHLADTDIFIDLRRNTPENWAHVFTNHMPIALLLGKFLKGQTEKRPIIVLPAAISQRIVRLFNVIGFRVISTNLSVHGFECSFDVTPWIAIRGERANIVRTHVDATLASSLATKDACLGHKVFISRKDTRRISNEGEVEDYLSKFGYKKVYLEDHSLETQISTVCFADEIVAVHGAALGPLILRPVFNNGSYRLIEIFSPAHVTDVFRILAHQSGGAWSGVRGNPWPELLRPRANFRNNIRDFNVCGKALQRAIEALRGPQSLRPCAP